MTITAALASENEMENRENPFLPDSRLSKETDDLLRHSTISRNTVILDDPKTYEQEAQQEHQQQQYQLNENHNGIEKSTVDGLETVPTHLNDASPQSVEVEVGIVAPSADSHMQVEHVKVKDSKKCKCCTIM